MEKCPFCGGDPAHNSGCIVNRVPKLESLIRELESQVEDLADQVSRIRQQLYDLS